MSVELKKNTGACTQLTSTHTSPLKFASFQSIKKLNSSRRNAGKKSICPSTF